MNLVPIWQYTPLSPPGIDFSFLQGTLGDPQSPSTHTPLHQLNHTSSPASDPDGQHESSRTNQKSTSQHHEKAHRLRKACDACSIRKVKCDESGPPCRSCAALEIPCTFERPSRRRGPPNRHAEAIKRQHDAALRHSPYTSSSNSPVQSHAHDHRAARSPTGTSAASPDAQSSSKSHPFLSAESICPLELVELLVDDFFTYNHPLQPFPHEPWFREAFRQRRDLSDRFFLALLAALVGTLISAFPRRPQKHLKTLGKESLFSSSVDFVRKCQAIVSEARGQGYLERDGLCAYDAATSYFMFIMCAHTYRFQEASLYLGECLAIVRTLRFDRMREDDDKEVDLVEEEMGRRVYWTIFVTVRSSTTFSASFASFPLTPPTPTRPHPPLPLEIDDAFIHRTHISPQPPNTVSLLTGFNTNVRVYLTLDPLLASELAYGIDHHFDWERQKAVVRRAIEAVKGVLDVVPETFLVWPGPPSRSSSAGLSLKSEGSDSLAELEIHRDKVYTSNPHGREADQIRHVAYEIQKANIHASILSTRSFLVERYWSLLSPRIPNGSLQNQHPERMWIQTEREGIAYDLLLVLSSIRPVHMEPNSVSFCMKVREIASTLLPSQESVHAGTADPTASARSLQYVRVFLEILNDLEKTGTGRENVGTEERELRKWADLREYQRDFVAKGGRIT